MAQVLLRLEDILVRHRDDIAARIADGLYHLLEALRLRDADGLRDRRALRRSRHLMVRLVERRALRRLHRDEVRQPPDLHEAEEQPYEHRAIADRHEDVIRHMVAELVVKLMRHRLDALEEQRIVDVRRVVRIAEVLLDRRARLHAAIGHLHDLGTVRLDLLDLLLRDVVRRVDRTFHVRSRRIRRHRSTRIARRVQRDLLDAEFMQRIDHAAGPAVLERPRRQQMLHLEQEIELADLEWHERRHELAERDLVLRHRLMRVLVQAEHAAAVTFVRMRIQWVFFLAVFTVEVHADRFLSLDEHVR